MSENEFPTTEENQEVQAVSDLLPGKVELTIHPFICKVEADNIYRIECWRIGDDQPLYSKSGFPEVDAAMLDGLTWLKTNAAEIIDAIQREIDKRTP